MATNYDRGRNFEYRVRKAFQELIGTDNSSVPHIFRTAGSHSPLDLIAIDIHWDDCACDTPTVWGIQCKYGTKITAKEKREFVSFCKKLRVIPVLAYAVPRGPIEWEYL